MHLPSGTTQVSSGGARITGGWDPAQEPAAIRCQSCRERLRRGDLRRSPPLLGRDSPGAAVENSWVVGRLGPSLDLDGEDTLDCPQPVDHTVDRSKIAPGTASHRLPLGVPWNTSEALQDQSVSGRLTPIPMPHVEAAGFSPSPIVGARREAHLSAKQHQAEEVPRFSRAHAHGRWAQRPSSEALQGSQATRSDDPDQEHLITAVVSGTAPFEPPPAAPRLTHPKRYRIRKTRDYRWVQGRGRKLRQEFLLAIALSGSTGVARMGITVSRKVGNAVTRNRVKRWLREAIRHERIGLEGVWDVVFIAHPSSANASASAIREDVSAVVRRLSSPSGFSDRQRTSRRRS